jgi:hypothetical protein
MLDRRCPAAGFVRRQFYFHRNPILSRAVTIDDDVNHPEATAGEERLNQLSGPNPNQRCLGFMADGSEPKTKKLTAKTTAMKVAADHRPSEISTLLVSISRQA